MLMISILNIPLFSSANEYEEFIEGMERVIDISTNLKSKGRGREKEINKIIENMLHALYHEELQTFETTHTVFGEVGSGTTSCF